MPSPGKILLVFGKPIGDARDGSVGTCVRRKYSFFEPSENFLGFILKLISKIGLDDGSSDLFTLKEGQEQHQPVN